MLGGKFDKKLPQKSVLHCGSFSLLSVQHKGMLVYNISASS